MFTKMHAHSSLIVGMLTGQGKCNEDQKEVCKLGKKEVTAGRGCLGKRQEVSRHSRSKGPCCMSTIRKTSPFVWPLLRSQSRESVALTVLLSPALSPACLHAIAVRLLAVECIAGERRA